jgi:hypothetical protein
MGNRGDIGAGDVQWMTAGRGVIHQEMPKGDSGGRMGGFQLWANLPAAQKMMGPRYRDVKKEQIPRVELEKGVTVDVICGEVDGTRGPVQDIVIEPQYLDVTVPARTEYIHPVRGGHTVFAYVISGRAFFCTERKSFSYEVTGRNYFDMDRTPYVQKEEAVLFGDRGAVAMATEEEPVRFLLISGKPIGEPVAWYGPIVMNTQKELEVAFEEYRNGTFIKGR